MYDFVNRAASMSDVRTIASLDPILGGPGWEARLDPTLPRGRAVEKLFRDTWRSLVVSDFVVSTKIDRPTADRPHFFIAYGTKSRDGLKTFRETEYNALKLNARDRADAKEHKREGQSGSPDLFSGFEADVQATTIDQIVDEQKALASQETLRILHEFGAHFFLEYLGVAPSGVHVTRNKRKRCLCRSWRKIGAIENSWGGGNRKPRDQDIINTEDLASFRNPSNRKRSQISPATFLSINIWIRLQTDDLNSIIPGKVPKFGDQDGRSSFL